MIIYKEKIYQPIESQLYSSWEEIETVTQKPLISWKAGKIPFTLWNNVKQICQHTNDEHSSECLIRLYFNSQTDEWKALVHPQDMNGMTVSDDIDMDLVLSLGDGFAEAGSVHHHCTSSAFQSGTDEKDEEEQPGLHITIGSMSKDIYDIHARYRTSNSFLEPDLMTFFETPNWLITCPERYHNTIMNDLLVKCEDGKQAPKEWINNCKKKTLTYSHHYNSGFGNPYRNASHYASQQVIKPKEKIKEKEETEDITQKEYDILEAQAEVLESSMYGEDRNYFDLIKKCITTVMKPLPD